MFRLITAMKRGTSSGMAEAWASYLSVEDARVGGAALFRDDRIQRVMIVRDEIPTSFVEWVER
jgi:hypothetical protein